ncbi:MAG: TetR/AcrR family transcriptional regulator [Flavobacteriaceae bacterium]|nr:TetR/AcrR family transcriptional regulator [Flavobacteriaceae bacterium]
MAKKKNLSKSDLITKYMNQTLEHGRPASVYALAKAQDFEEQQFYQYFGTLETLETEIFTVFFDNTLVALEKSGDYQSFDARNKLLSFYFTFFENLSANRSYVLLSLNGGDLNLKDLKKLSGLRKGFLNFVSGLDIKDDRFRAGEKSKNFKRRPLRKLPGRNCCSP